MFTFATSSPDEILVIFTALRGMQTRFYDENSVRLFVLRLSVCQTRALWQNGKKSVQLFVPRERAFSLVFWEEEWLVGGDPFYPKFWINRPPLVRNRRFWTNNRSYSASAVISSVTVQLNRKSPTSFPVSLRWHHTLPLSPTKGAQKRKTAFFL